MRRGLSVFLSGLLISGVSVAAFLGGAAIKLRPRRDETVEVLICAYSAETADLELAYEDDLPEGCRKLRFLFAGLDASDFYRLYDTYAPNMDIIVLPDSLAAEGLSSDSVSLVGENAEGWGEASFYEENGEKKGVLCREKGGDGLWGDLVTYSKDGAEGEDYHAFFPETSVYAERMAEGESVFPVEFLKSFFS